MSPETILQNQIRARLGREPDLMLGRNNVGNPITLDGRRKHYGLQNGSADLIGTLAPHGRTVALEVKTPTGVVEPHQAVWLACVRRFGGFACVVRSVDDAIAALERARKGASE